MRFRSLLLVTACLLLIGCPDMKEQPRYEPLEEVAGPVRPAGTVPAVPPEPPPELSRRLLERGRERYAIYCTPCHGPTGHGDGVIVRHGFPRPPSFHLERLRDVPNAHLYSAITNGAGVMYPYADRIAPGDRWAIVHYVRVLQLAYEEDPS